MKYLINCILVVPLFVSCMANKYTYDDIYIKRNYNEVTSVVTNMMYKYQPSGILDNTMISVLPNSNFTQVKIASIITNRNILVSNILLTELYKSEGGKLIKGSIQEKNYLLFTLLNLLNSGAAGAYTAADNLYLPNPEFTFWGSLIIIGLMDVAAITGGIYNMINNRNDYAIYFFELSLLMKAEVQFLAWENANKHNIIINAGYNYKKNEVQLKFNVPIN